MHSQVSQKLSDKRIEWQNATVTAMQKKLFSRPSGRYSVSQFDSSLVVVYGDTQTGKTSLILQIMGVLPKYQREVYRVLRAGQKYGNSSTVTAIFYHVSDTDSYGISVSERISDNLVSNMTGEEMILRLAEIRKEIETGKKGYQLLHIFIPFRYFNSDVLDHESFSIMDLPGINSKNSAEQGHVDLVVARYMALATARIIVTKGDSIQNLERMNVPENVDWSAFPNRYFIVVTMAFSQGSVKKYFNTPKSDRKITFIQYLENSYAPIYDIISSKAIEWYPVDVGESFRNLVRDYSADAEEIIDAQDYYIRQIRKAIINRKGNGLSNIIHDLNTFSRDYYSVNIRRISENIDHFEKDIKVKEERLKLVLAQHQMYRSAVEKYTPEKIRDFAVIEKFNPSSISRSINNDIDDFLIKIATEYPARFSDHELRMIDLYTDMVASAIRRYNDLNQAIGNRLFYRIYPEGIDIKISSDGIVSGVPKRLCSQLSPIICEQILNLKHILRPKGIDFYFKQVSRSDMIVVFSDMFTSIKKEVEKRIFNDISCAFSEIRKERDIYYLNKHLLDRKEEEIKEIHRHLPVARRKRTHEKRSLREWQKMENTDTQLLREYLEVASSEYFRSKNEIKKEMKEKPLNERLHYLILLGLMEHDFNLLMENR